MAKLSFKALRSLLPHSNPQAQTVLSEPQISEVREQELGWEVSRYDLISRSERRAWLVARYALGGALLLALSLCLLMPLKTVAPFVVQTDSLTGESRVLRLAGPEDIPLSELMHKHWVSLYVRTRENYDWRTLEQDYLLVRELSLPGVFDLYDRQYGTNDPKSLQLTLKDEVRIVSELSSVVINTENIATVRFCKVTYDNGTGAEKSRSYWTATLAFEYFPKFEIPEERLIVNPFGFKITSYRVDPEFTGENHD